MREKNKEGQSTESMFLDPARTSPVSSIPLVPSRMLTQRSEHVRQVCRARRRSERGHEQAAPGEHDGFGEPRHVPSGRPPRRARAGPDGGRREKAAWSAGPPGSASPPGASLHHNTESELTGRRTPPGSLPFDSRNPTSSCLSARPVVRPDRSSQTPTLNARPLKLAILSCIKRGVTVELWLGIGFNDQSESLAFQGGTNLYVAEMLLEEAKNSGRDELLKIFWYTGKSPPSLACYWSPADAMWKPRINRSPSTPSKSLATVTSVATPRSILRP